MNAASPREPGEDTRVWRPQGDHLVADAFTRPGHLRSPWMALLAAVLLWGTLVASTVAAVVVSSLAMDLVQPIFGLRPLEMTSSLVVFACSVAGPILALAAGIRLLADDPRLFQLPVQVRLTPTRLDLGTRSVQLHALTGVRWPDGHLRLRTGSGVIEVPVTASRSVRQAVVSRIREEIERRGSRADVPPSLRALRQRDVATLPRRTETDHSTRRITTKASPSA